MELENVIADLTRQV